MHLLGVFFGTLKVSTSSRTQEAHVTEEPSKSLDVLGIRPVAEAFSHGTKAVYRGGFGISRPNLPSGRGRIRSFASRQGSVMAREERACDRMRGAGSVPKVQAECRRSCSSSACRGGTRARFLVRRQNCTGYVGWPSSVLLFTRWTRRKQSHIRQPARAIDGSPGSCSELWVREG